MAGKKKTKEAVITPESEKNWERIMLRVPLGYRDKLKRLTRKNNTTIAQLTRSYYKAYIERMERNDN